MIKAVIFDWGGVIAPNPNGGWLNVLVDELGLPFDDVLAHWQAAGYEELSKGLVSEATFWSQFEKSLGRPLSIDTSKVWRDGSALEPWPEIVTYIQSLRNRGIKTAILSNTVSSLSKTLREKGEYDGFDCVILSDEVGLVKPDPQIYQLVLDQLGVSAQECLYIDDLQRNLVPAEKLGIKTLLASHEPSETIIQSNKLVG